MSRERGDFFECPHCGAQVPAGAAACPECGSDEETGWSQEREYDNLDLPEPGHGKQEERPANAKAVFWILTSLIVLILILMLVTKLR